MSYKIKSKIWIEINDEVLIGKGSVTILKEVDKQKSLSKAAKSLGISYKKAWNLIAAVNKSGGKKVITTRIGGKNGGGAQLTDYGKELIQVFENIQTTCGTHLDKQLHQLEKL